MSGRWLLLLAATAGGGWLLDAAGLESPLLFAALLAGLASALLADDGSPEVPGALFTAAQAVLGVSLGTLLETSSLTAAAHAWAGVVLVSAGTLAVCLLAGVALARFARADPPTAVLGLVAGGASGIVAMASELGADDRIVAFMQYLRVLVVVLVTPIVAAVAFGSGDGGGAGSPSPSLLGDFEGWAVTVVLAPAGLLLARGLRVTAGSLLGPLALAAALSLSDVLGTITVPGVLQDAAFVGIGLQVGLRFTPGAVREVGRLLVPTLLAIALIVACFGLAALLTATTDVPLLDAYLATTPGGLYAVLAAAFGSGADTTFILAVQTLRLFVMILLAPVLVRRIVGERPANVSGSVA